MSERLQFAGVQVVFALMKMEEEFMTYQGREALGDVKMYFGWYPEDTGEPGERRDVANLLVIPRMNQKIKKTRLIFVFKFQAGQE